MVQKGANELGSESFFVTPFKAQNSLFTYDILFQTHTLLQAKAKDFSSKGSFTNYPLGTHLQCVKAIN